MSKIHFVTFGSPQFYRTLERVHVEAITSEFFDEYHVFTEKDLPEDILEYCENNKRGYGFYIWKPYLVDLVINQIPENDIIVWCDCGNSIFRNGKERFDEYIKLVNESEYANLGFEGWSEHYELIYGKRQIFDFLDAKDFLELKGGGLGLVAGMFIIRNTKFTRQLVKLWKETCFNHKYLIDDTPEPHNNQINWDNRCDQPVWSVIRRKYGCVIIPHPIPNYKKPIDTDFFSELDEEKVPVHGTEEWENKKKERKIPIMTTRYRF
jgi:hypothetical protein